MKNYRVVGVIVAILSVTLSGCTLKSGAVTGAAVGVSGAGMLAFLGLGIVGAATPAAFVSPPVVAFLFGGALIGGLVGGGVGYLGYLIGNLVVSTQDCVHMLQAVTAIPISEGARWESIDAAWGNKKSRHITYQFHPIRQTYEEGLYCRQYELTILAKGKTKVSQGKACFMPHNDRWVVIHGPGVCSLRRAKTY